MSERLWVLKGSIFYFLPQNVSKMEENRQKTAQNEPKLRESCAPWQKLRACTKTQKLRKSCAVQHRNFLGGGLNTYDCGTPPMPKPTMPRSINIQL